MNLPLTTSIWIQKIGVNSKGVEGGILVEENTIRRKTAQMFENSEVLSEKQRRTTKGKETQHNKQKERIPLH